MKIMVESASYDSCSHAAGFVGQLPPSLQRARLSLHDPDEENAPLAAAAPQPGAAPANRVPSNTERLCIQHHPRCTGDSRVSALALGGCERRGAAQVAPALRMPTDRSLRNDPCRFRSGYLNHLPP